jgi:phospholipase C
MASLNQIDTIVVVMLENRSFDHVLGYLRLPSFDSRQDIDGLINTDTDPRFANIYDHQIYRPFEMTDGSLIHDLPHARNLVDVQLALRDGTYTMSGFVDAYARSSQSLENQPIPMGYMTPKSVPISNFLARNYMVCDRWFAPLPADTQPNRAMAFSGSALIDDTKAQIIPCESLVLDWLTNKSVRWRVYHCGMSFFLLFGAFGHALSDNFRSIQQLPADFQHEPDATVPQVIFVEPDYGDSPVHFGAGPNDNHPPLAMGPGESFLRDVYAALSGNPKRWARTVLIVTYDEHGGFFDHVPPLPIKSPVPPGAQYSSPFSTTGVRVPATIISPLVPSGSSFHGNLDHTSILQLFGEQFAGGAGNYSASVNSRMTQGIESVSAAFASVSANRTDIPVAPSTRILASSALRSVKPLVTENQSAFALAATSLMAQDTARALAQFPELVHFKP